MIVSIVAAVAENNVIGNNNQLLWHLPADLMHFKSLTMGHHVLMGRKTFESIGKVLSGRKFIIISRNKKLKIDGAKVVKSFQEGIIFAKKNDENELFIIGGGEIYAQSLEVVKKMYITKVHKSFLGDTEFPYFNSNDWKLLEEEHHEADHKNLIGYSFLTFKKKK